MARSIKKVFIRVLICVSILCYARTAYCDVLVLKSGKSVEGAIVENNDDCVKIDFEGAVLTYFKDEVERIKPGTNPAPKEIKNRKSFLWKGTGKNSTVYLLGSMHVGKEDMYPLNKDIENVFNEAEVLAVEFDASNIKPSDAQIVLERGTYPLGDSIQNHLSPETFEIMRNALANMNINLVKVLKYKPWLLVMMFTRLFFLDAGFDADLGMDVYLLQKAKGNKKIVELESFEYQLDLLSNLTDKEQDALISATFDASGYERDEGINVVTQAWQKGDSRAIAGLTSEHEKDEAMASFEQKLLAGRNKNMADKVEKFLNDKGVYLVVVGAAHYVGQDSIIDMLAKKGYKFKRL